MEWDGMLKACWLLIEGGHTTKYLGDYQTPRNWNPALKQPAFHGMFERLNTAQMVETG